VNEFAAGGISVASPILSILGAMSTTVGTGGASIVSRMLGKGNKEDAANVTSNAMMVYWIFAIACTALGLLFIEPLLQLLGCTDSLMVYAKGYACIILLGAIISTAFSAIIRAEGDTKFSMYMWMVPVIANLILDSLFILVLKWGVRRHLVRVVPR
jgi:Na+-driven multidrug efflux pump